ncbi:MAG: helix-hairpin-helix domain-containing protein [Candidatus Binatia bacterium]
MRERFDIAADLREIARRLEIKGENRFKTQAYERGASALENHVGELEALVKAGRLKEIPGIGNALAALIEEIYWNGECWMLQQLREEMPPGVMEQHRPWTESQKNLRASRRVASRKHRGSQNRL